MKKLLFLLSVLLSVGLIGMDKPEPAKSSGVFSKIKGVFSTKLTPEQATEKLRKLIDSEKEKINVETIAPLLANGADKEVKNARGKTILVRAVEESNSPLVAYLLKEGANPNSGTPLVKASFLGNVDIVKQLIRAHADPNAIGEDHLSALWFAAHIKNPTIVKLLLEAGANVNFQSPMGSTPLHVVLTEPNYIYQNMKGEKDEIIGLLLSHGADVTIADFRGQKPSDFLKKSKSNQANQREIILDETSLKLLQKMKTKKENVK